MRGLPIISYFPIPGPVGPCATLQYGTADLSPPSFSSSSLSADCGGGLFDDSRDRICGLRSQGQIRIWISICAYRRHQAAN
jgi:hypothetical protein